MLNQFPLWKNIMLVVILILAAIYSLPNLYGEDPSIQVTGNTSAAKIDVPLVKEVKQALEKSHIKTKAVEEEKDNLLVRFYDTDSQFKALPIVRATIGTKYTAAVNISPATPNWLSAIGGVPMKKGLDLQGGIHFLLDVDVQSAISRRVGGMLKNMGDNLRNQRIRYTGIVKQKDGSILLSFKTAELRDKADSSLGRDFPNLTLIKGQHGSSYQITAQFSAKFLQNIRDYTIGQTLTTLRNRVNELGISEPLVQQQGAARISVDLPGVQDSAQAKQILGGTATLQFHLVDNSHDVSNVVNSGIAPAGTRLYHMTDSSPILLKNQVVLSGDSITSATSSFGQDGRPNVNITLGGGGESYFSRITRDNVGNRMAIVYVETKTTSKMVNGKAVKQRHKVERVISAPVIQSALGMQFQITGIGDPKEAKTLALLLRAGAMPVNVDIIEERTVGASLGQANIRMGMLSVEVAFALIVLCMALYYGIFGLIANLALGLNLLLLVAVLSILGMTLTLPGIAGIVLTVGMAVDANVLIFERIREELRGGLTIQTSIHAGFERALSTIIDANVTTLIVAIVLFSIGSGPIKGFAVTLTVGLITSMFTAVTFTRGLVNLGFGGRTVKKLPIGI